MFLLLVAVLAVTAGLALVQLEGVRLDARRFVEESREARLAHEMEKGLEQLQLLSQAEGRLDDPSFSAQTLALARSQLEQLDASERAAADPSSPEHESSEQAQFQEMREGLDRLEAALGERAGALDADLLWQVQEAAAGVADETDEEVASATADLRARVDRLVRVTIATLLIVIAILVALWLLTRRNVVKPLESLRRGARAFGGGDLGHRIPVSSSDEIGVLSEEFNRMADSLTGTQRDLERRVRERTAELIRAARLADLGTFAAGIAHEVNTPLASIASCAEGLQRRVQAGTATREEQVEYLQTIAHEAYRAHEITKRLLALARKDSGAVAPLDARAVIGNVARLVDHEMSRRGIRLALDVDDRAPAALANAAELEQLLLNLIKNAADASPPGGTVTLRCRGAADRLVLEVEDEGPGIPEDRKDAIFEPFFTTKRPGEGTGLGLAIAQSIVEGHRGSIQVEGGANGGALFRVLLPKAAGAPEAA
jgi:signal transduction histidine kinase